MKKLVFGGLILTLVGIISVGCKKEIQQQIKPNSSTSLSKTIDNNANQAKSSHDIIAMAQAADIKRIKYLGNNRYQVDTYINSMSYKVKVDSFNPQYIVNMEVVNSNNKNRDFEVNVSDSSVVIANVGTFSFDNYIEEGISKNQVFERNLAAVMSAYCADTPGVTTGFTDNGDDDVYKPGMHPAFGWDTSTVTTSVSGDCVNITYENHYLFWFRVSRDVINIEPC